MKLTEEQAWLALADAADNADDYGRMPAPCPCSPHVGLCIVITGYYDMGLISKKTCEAIERKIECRTSFKWRNNKEGCKQRAEFCRSQAKAVKTTSDSMEEEAEATNQRTP